MDFRGRSGGGLKVGGLEGEGNRLTGTEGYYRWSGKMERGKRLSWGETSRWSRREGCREQREEDLEGGGDKLSGKRNQKDDEIKTRN